jgi:endonuclease/exonuclease/phosphatase family metal-dependent hydrolase
MKYSRRNALWRTLLGVICLAATISCSNTAVRDLATATPPTESVVLETTVSLVKPTIALEAEVQELQFLTKPEHTSLRVLSYNINWDSIFPANDPENHDFRSADRVDSFRRIVHAVQPDIVCLQEINPARDPDEVGNIIEVAEDSSNDSDWQTTGARDSVIATRFNLLQDSYKLVMPAFPSELAQAGALVDLPDASFGDENIYVICSHFKSGGSSSDILMRQRQADSIVSFVRDATTSGGEIDLPEETGLIIMGDLNTYDTDPAQHLTTLLTGNIDNEDRYGPDIHPDWDATDLSDALPSHNGSGDEQYTWREDSGPFAPGILDHILYSDSVLRLDNAFVLNTTVLSDKALAAAGLQAEDVLLDPANGYFDHLPLITDFSLIQNP